MLKSQLYYFTPEIDKPRALVNFESGKCNTEE